MRFTLRRKDRLKSQKLIDKIFDEGNSITVFPLKLFYVKTSLNEKGLCKMGCSVSSRNFRKAHERNRIKRLIRESYRRLRPEIFNNMTTQCAFMILYIGKSMPAYEHIDKALEQLLKKLKREVSS